MMAPCKSLVLLCLLVAVIGLHVPHSEAKRRYRKAKATCGGTIKVSKGESSTFESPNYPDNYPAKSKCKWKFKVKEEVEVNCDVFDLAVTSKCSDYLQFKTKNNKSKFCGSSLSSLTLTSKKINMLFKSHKRSKTAPGFSCTIGPKSGGGGGSIFTLTAEESASFTDEQKTKVEQALADAESDQCTSNGGTCSCSVTKADSFYFEKVVGSQRFVVTNGIPNHDYETGQDRPNPNNACPHWIYFLASAEPTSSDTFTTSGMGPVGVAVSGGFFYNHLSSPDGSVAVVQEGESFDTCNGHSDPNCRYHYHKNPECLMSSALSCDLTGYMFDGFPVYSYCPKPGTSVALKSCYKLTSGDGSNASHYTFDEDGYNAGTCDLDMANGYTFSDGYAYVFSQDYPFIMPGYYGTQASACYIS
ncbi:unnamed protein product [Meganyctiphanes norvegica]|uniref:CUB domain-containing protein n=1 Tax=Meganyctiphanes norvegica TaxID=48144 RepID=A0AAV2RCP6_MEGNR